MIGAGFVATAGCIGVGSVGSTSTGWVVFLDLFFLGRVAHSVRFRPALGLLALLGFDEAVGGVATGLREEVLSKLKIGSPSSSKSCVVLTSQAGYLRDGLTFAAKFASDRSRAFSGVDNRFWK